MQIGRHQVRIGRSASIVLVMALLLIAARVAFDIASASAYVYPEHDFGQSGVALLFLFLALLTVLIFAIVRLFQRRFIDTLALLIVLSLAFLPFETIERHHWKFRAHKAEYQFTVQADPSPRYHVFNWPILNGSALGRGIVAEAIIYDESDEIAGKAELRSAEWIGRRSKPTPDEFWIASDLPFKNLSCRRITETYGEHFFYHAVEC